MKTIFVTGSNGFMGKNLLEGLKRQENLKIKTFDIEDDMATLRSHLKKADFVFHLAGVNRPQKSEEFEIGNVDLTKTIVSILEEFKRPIPIVFSSSTQATLENPYGISKKRAENILLEYGKINRATVFIYRLPNVFGKWCRPNYNSVVATFCYNITHNLEISISDPNKEIELVYIDDVVEDFLRLIKQDSIDDIENYCHIKRTFKIMLGKLAEIIYQIRDVRKTSIIPDLSDKFTNFLYATYQSYLDKDDFSYKLDSKTDHRGSLTELLKSKHFGQFFISKSFPSIKRGNHYHNTKIEKFCVIKGKAAIKLRSIFDDQILTYNVSGEYPEVVDIPPGYTHSIENIGQDELITLFWSDELFDPERPDTFHEEV
jgi:UDP-2-acetamido-2,6-beta-L-arabino-hexul-4-ose reductase